MITLFTKEELIAKGIKKSDVFRLMKKVEKLVGFYSNKHTQGKCTPNDNKAWDIACQKWDHLKDTLNNFEK